MKAKLYEHIARKLQAVNNCAESGNTEWEEKHKDAVFELCDKYLPSGSGIDSGVKFPLSQSTPNKLVFFFGYHHMTEGMYDGWTEHKLIVTPSLANGFDMRITGPDRGDIKEYLYQLFEYALSQEVEE